MPEVCPLCRLAPGREVRSVPTVHLSCTSGQPSGYQSEGTLSVARMLLLPRTFLGHSYECILSSNWSICKDDRQDTRSHEHPCDSAAQRVIATVVPLAGDGRCDGGTMDDSCNLGSLLCQDFSLHARAYHSPGNPKSSSEGNKHQAVAAEAAAKSRMCTGQHSKH